MLTLLCYVGRSAWRNPNPLQGDKKSINNPPFYKLWEDLAKIAYTIT